MDREIPQNIQDTLVQIILKYGNDQNGLLQCLYPNSLSFILNKDIIIEKVLNHLVSFVSKKETTLELLEFFIEDIKKDVSSYSILCYKLPLNHSFIKKYPTFLNWKIICDRTDLTISFLKKYNEYISIMALKDNLRLSQDIQRYVEGLEV